MTKTAIKEKYAAEAKELAKRWNVSITRAYEAIMKRIDRGLPPLPPVQKKAATASVKSPKLVNVNDEEKNKILADLKKLGLPVPAAIVKVPAVDSMEKAVMGGHYDLPHPVSESIELIELVMIRENIPPVARFMISQALRYIVRDGVKTSDWKNDIAKAENYLHRAITGKWNTGK